MSGNTTARMIAAYNQQAEPTMFLSGFFQSPAQNFHTSEEVEIDIVRSDEDVAVVLQDLGTGYRMNSEELYINKGFKPPIFKEAVPINSHDLLKRMPGVNPFEQPDFRADVMLRMFSSMKKVERKIRRALELQASQVMQVGKVSLTDINGTVLFGLDYKPKTTHFVTVGTAWNAPGSTKIADINALAEVIRADGLADPDQLIMGTKAFEAFISDDAVIKRFDARRIDLGTVSPMQINGKGGSYRGTVEIGNYRYDIWTYGGRYKHPQTGASTPFLDPAKVIVRASSGRMDATFGAIPNIGSLMGAGSARLLPELPSRMANSEGGMDLFTNVWLSPDGEQLIGGVGARPLMIPTAIDTFGCLATGV